MENDGGLFLAKRTMEQSLDAIISQRKAQEGPRPPRGPKARRNGGRGAARGGSGAANVVKVTNLHKDLTQQDIESLFSKAGDIKSVDLKINTQGVSTGVATVEFVTKQSASRAIDMFHRRQAVGNIINVTSSQSLSERMNLGGQQQQKKKKDGKVAKTREPRPKKVVKTAEDLDNELALYMQQQQEQPQQQEEPSEATGEPNGVTEAPAEAVETVSAAAAEAEPAAPAAEDVPMIEE